MKRWWQRLLCAVGLHLWRKELFWQWRKCERCGRNQARSRNGVWMRVDSDDE